MKSIKGRHLWLIKLKFRACEVIVQTTENSQLQAFRKAQRFIESTKGLKPPKDLSHSEIKTVTYFGTIDA